MDEWALRFRVGVVVVASTIVLVILLMLFGAGANLWRPHYVIHVQFPEAPGVTVDTPVRKSGVLIGRVSDVQLLDEGGVLVSARIEQKYILRRNELCRIGSGSLLGDTILEFVPCSKQEALRRFDKDEDGRLDQEEEQYSFVSLNDGEYVSEGAVSNNPFNVLVDLEDDFVTTLQSIEEASQEVSQLARAFNKNLQKSDMELSQIVQRADNAMQQMQAAAQSVQNLSDTANTVLTDEELLAAAKDLLKRAPKAIDEFEKTAQSVRATSERFQTIGQKAERNLDNLEKVTQPLGESGRAVAENIEAGSENLREILDQLALFSQALNNREGAIGRLLHEDEAYEEVLATAASAKELVRRLRPILDDVRIFSDKIARDPRLLGVRGALERRPTGSGLKTPLR